VRRVHGVGRDAVRVCASVESTAQPLSDALISPFALLIPVDGDGLGGAVSRRAPCRRAGARRRARLRGPRM
jgi:hypothetical protein